MNEYDIFPLEYSDFTVTLPDDTFAKEPELYLSVVGGTVYLKTKRQYSRFMNGAKRIGYGKIAEFYRACMNNTFVLEQHDNRFEICPEIAEVLGEDEPVQIIIYRDTSGAVIAKKSFFDEKLDK